MPGQALSHLLCPERNWDRAIFIWPWCPLWLTQHLEKHSSPCASNPSLCINVSLSSSRYHQHHYPFPGRLLSACLPSHLFLQYYSSQWKLCRSQIWLCHMPVQRPPVSSHSHQKWILALLADISVYTGCKSKILQTRGLNNTSVLTVWRLAVLGKSIERCGFS